MYAVVKYPKNIFTPVSINRASSSFIFFVEETIDQEEGIIIFAYFTITPIDSEAIVGDISFERINKGDVKEGKELTFSSDSMVLAHDGYGTDVLTNTTPLGIK